MLDVQSPSVFTFQFHNCTDHEIRTIQKEDGSIWFVAKDVCQTLNFSETAAATRYLDEDESMAVKLTGMNMKSIIISESGLYSLVLRSRKPEAKVFRKWVTSEVLPQIRRTGSYIPDIPAAKPQVTSKTITAFLQATTDTFWGIEKALTEYRLAEANLRKARKDTSKIIRAIKEAFPEVQESVDLLGGMDERKLEIEVR